MFTGLIQAQGIIYPQGSDRFQINIPPSQASAILKELVIGDSIAVDGVCLTVEQVLSEGFVATASSETLERTNLGHRSESSGYVNLEPSLKVGAKLGGHFVMGHVDGVGRLLQSVPSDRSWEITFAPLTGASQQWHQTIAPYLIPKGSIAVNGISLTIADCDPEGSWFQCAVIPLTYQETNLSSLREGDWVNLESDILGKYVEKLLNYRSRDDNDISCSFLAEHGYL